MSLMEKIARVVSFNVLQTILSKGISFVSFAILIHLLSVEEIGIIGLAGGYVAIMGFVLILPESVFIRDFVKIKTRMNDYVSAFLGFAVLRSLVLFLIGLPIAWWIVHDQGSAVAGIYFLLLVLTTLLNSMVSPMREAFYANYRQARITFVDLTLNGLSLASLIILFFSRSVLTYGALQVGVSLLGIGWWYWNARKNLNFSFRLPADWLTLSYTTIRGFVLWNHLAGMVSRLVYQADIVILSFFVGLAALGEYTVALTIANVFFVLPQLLQKVSSLSFSQINGNESLRESLGVLVRYNTFFSLAQLIGFILAGTWIISILGPSNPGVVYVYALYLAAGVTLLNLVRPWISLAVVRVPPKDFFFQLFLFPCAIAVILFWFAAEKGGALGVAQANVLAFSIMGIWTILYVSIRLRVRPRLFYLTEFEKKFIHRFWKKK